MLYSIAFAGGERCIRNAEVASSILAGGSKHLDKKPKKD
jgi:hypothetical protein